MSERDFPLYEDVEDALATAETSTSPAEAHGLISGLICAGSASSVSGDSWARSMFPGMSEQVLSKEQQRVLSDLFEVTRDKINNLEFDFQILLPDDECSLQHRAEELGYWCYGFTVGLSLGEGVTDISIYSDDCKEALQRMQDIANIDYEMLAISEDDEFSFFEVAEYVRLAVLMIRSEIHRESGASDLEEPNKTIH